MMDVGCWVLMKYYLCPLCLVFYSEIKIREVQTPPSVPYTY